MSYRFEYPDIDLDSIEDNNIKKAFLYLFNIIEK